MTVLETEGYLSNMVADETGCGAPHAPWRIKAKPGLYVFCAHSLSDIILMPSARAQDSKFLFFVSHNLNASKIIT